MRQLISKNNIKKILVSLLIGMQLSPIGLAAPLMPGDQEEQNRKARQEALAKQQRENQADVFLQQKQTSAEDLTLPAEEISFPIDSIQLEGENTENFSKLKEYLKKYEGKSIGIQGIQLILNRASRLLLNQGYVTTRILLREQKLHTGTLKIFVLPGKIESIEFEDQNLRANWKTAFPTRPGNLLNIRDLEQGLEQLKRIASRDVDFQIKPGSLDDQSRILIKAAQKNPLHVTLTADDSGSKATGKIQLSAGITLDNPFNANDILRLSLNHDGEKNGAIYGTKGYGIHYSIPNGNWTYALSANRYEYHQSVETGYDSFMFSGESEETRLSIEKLINRTQNSKTSIEMGLSLKTSHSYVNDAEITMQERKTSAFQLGIAHRKYIGQDLLDIRLGVKQGMPWFNAQEDPAQEIPDLPTLRYQIWNLDTLYITPLKLGKTTGQYKFSLSGQYTRDKLYAAECVSLGNRYTVRGFSGEETLLGDKGMYIQNEVSVPLKHNQQFFVGLDYGLVRGYNTEYLTSRTLVGSVAGLRGTIGNSSQYEIFVGWALKKPEGMQEGKPVYGFQYLCQL